MPHTFIEVVILFLTILKLYLELPVLLFQNFVLKLQNRKLLAETRQLLAERANRADEGKQVSEPFHGGDSTAQCPGGDPKSGGHQ